MLCVKPYNMLCQIFVIPFYEMWDLPDIFVQTLWEGLVGGTLYALIALGLSVIFGLLDIINIAHGDFFMVGTVLSWFVLQMTGDFSIGFLVTPLICFILGALIQLTVIQPLHGAAERELRTA